MAVSVSCSMMLSPSFTAMKKRPTYSHSEEGNGEALNALIMAGSGNKELANKVCDILNVTPSHLKLKRFSDGEVSLKMFDSMRGKDVFIIQSCAAPVNDNMMELLLMISCARRCGARRVICVVPYFGYKYHRRGETMSTKNQSRFLWSASSDFFKMMTVMGCDKVLSVDLHRPGQGQETSYSGELIPVETITSHDLMIDYIKENIKLSPKVTVVAAASEYLKKARIFQTELQKTKGIESVELAAFLRKSDSFEVRRRTVSRLLGEVKGTDVIVIDGMVETAGSLSALCQVLAKEEAKDIYLCAPHGLFTGNSMELVHLSPVKKVIVTDSLPLPDKPSDKIVQVSVAKYIAKIIEKDCGKYRKQDIRDECEYEEEKIGYD
jgi:ribose-phosphate pyrophosphokinase